MKKLASLSLMIMCLSSYAQVAPENTQFEPSATNPWGLPDPDSPNVTDFKEMIGTCDCKSVSRANQVWGDTTNMVWKFKYIMNGTAVQDEVWRNGRRYAGSIRQFQPDSAEWIVTYFSNPGIPYNPPVWHGKRENDQIVLYREQKAPNGTDGYYRLTFYDLSDEGFNWKGEWVNTAETFAYPTWMIFCKQRE